MDPTLQHGGIVQPRPVSPPPSSTPTEVSYPAYSPSPSSVDAHNARPQRIAQWTQGVPTIGRPSPSLGRSAGVGSSGWSEDLDTVREGEAAVAANNRRNSKRMSIPLPPQLPPPTRPLPPPPGSSGRMAMPSARPPPMAYLASSPTVQQTFNEYSLPRSEQLVYPGPAPGPMPLGHSARSEREVYLSSALSLPLEMISELAPPSFGQSPPDSRPPSPSKSGRVGAFLTRAKSTVSLRSEKGGGHDQSSDHGSRDPTPPGRQSSPIPDMPAMPSHFGMVDNGARPFPPVRRASHGVVHHHQTVEPAVNHTGEPLRRGRSSSTGSRPPGFAPVPMQQAMQQGMVREIQPGQMMARSPSSSRPPQPINNMPPFSAPERGPAPGSAPSGPRPGALSPVPQSPPSASVHVGNVAPALVAPFPATPPQPQLHHPQAQLPHPQAQRASQPVQVTPMPQPFGIRPTQPQNGARRHPAAVAVPPPTSFATPRPTPPEQPAPPRTPALKSASTERLAERLRGPARPNASTSTTDSPGMESLDTPAKRVNRLRVSMGWLHSRNRNEAESSQGNMEDQRSVKSKKSTSKFSDSGCSHTGSARSKLSSVQDLAPSSPIPRSASQPIALNSKRHSLHSPSQPLTQPHLPTSHHHASSLPNADMQYPPGMATPQRQVMPRGLPTPSPPHDGHDRPEARGPMWHRSPPSSYPPPGGSHNPSTPVTSKGMAPTAGPWTPYQATPISPPVSPRISHSAEHLPSHPPRKQKWRPKMWPFGSSSKSTSSSPLSSPLGRSPQSQTTRHWQDESSRGRAAATSTLRRSRSMTPPRNRFTFHRNDKSSKDKHSRSPAPSRQEPRVRNVSQTSMSNDRVYHHNLSPQRSLSDSGHGSKLIISKASNVSLKAPHVAAAAHAQDKTAVGPVEMITPASPHPAESVFDLHAAVRMNEQELGQRGRSSLSVDKVDGAVGTVG